MGKSRRHCGFSLVEVLLAVGTLSVGMIFIGGTYLVGVHLAGISTERTTATVVANEAFTKIRLFGVNKFAGNLDPNYSSSYAFGVPTRRPFAYDEFAYPSWGSAEGKQYFWSAICRPDPNDPERDLLVTVFVSRKIGDLSFYPLPTPAQPAGQIAWPVALPVGVEARLGSAILTVKDDPATPFDERQWIGRGYTIVEDSTGDIYRVVKHVDNTISDVELDRPWNPHNLPWDPGITYPLLDNVVWVVPPSFILTGNPPNMPVSRGRGPCVGVYQGKITFNEL